MSIKIGILLAAYNVESTIEEALKGWEGVDFTFKIVASAIPFKQYSGFNKAEDGTIKLLKSHKFISKVITEPQFIEEHEARTLSLKELIKFEPELIMLQDGDEFPKTEELNAIVKWLDETPAAWYRLNYMNLVFDGNSYVEGFCPPRIFRFKIGSMMLDSLYYDNDACYFDGFNKISYKDLPESIVPKEIAFIKHRSWTHDVAKDKILYQEKRWGKNSCSYSWDDQQQKVTINYEFFRTRGLPFPIVLTA